jgi:hypothetical protein
MRRFSVRFSFSENNGRRVYASATMTKLLLGGTLLLVGVFAGSLSAQDSGSISGQVALQSSGEGIPEVSITLCLDTGRQVVSVTDGSTGIPARDLVREIRIQAPGDGGQVTITSVTADCSNARHTTTDNTGRFVFSGVANGLYKVHAQRNGYIGQPPRESLRGSAPEIVTQSVNVADPRAVPDISFSLIKGGAIAGTVLDANGKPVASAVVVLLPATGEPRPLVSKQTDDRGQYRLFGLLPGEFGVAVRREAIRTGPAQQLSYKQYPKTIILREDEEVSGIDIVMTLP